MTEDTTYNGWTNYPTWCVNLWLDNDEGIYSATMEIVGQGMTCADDHPNVPFVWTQDEANVYGVADMLKGWVTNDLTPDLGASFPADLLGWALGHVNWEEIARSWISSYVTQVTEDA